MTAAPLVPLAAAMDSPPGLESLAQYGILGVGCAAFAWFAYKAYVREAQRADRLDAEVARLHTVIQERVLPAILATTEVVKDYTNLLRERRDPWPGAWHDEHTPTAGHGEDHR